MASTNQTLNLTINRTNTTSNVNPDQEAPLSQFIGISVGVFAIMGLLGNFLVLTVMWIAPSKKRLPTYRHLITHLSTCDLISSLLLILYTPLELHKHVWIYPEWFCPVLYPSITIAANLATGTILIIALEHYLGIVKPHWNQMNKSKVVMGLFCVWAWATVTVFPNIASLRLSTGDYIFCGEFWDGHEDMQKLYGLSFFFVAFFIPFSAIAYLYGHIIHKLRQTQVQYHSTLSPGNPDTRHAIHVLSLMIISFAICVSPNKILFFVYDVAPSAWNAHTHFYLRTIQVLYYGRVAVNPIVYCIFDNRFKKDCIYIINRLCGTALLQSWIARNSRDDSLLSPQTEATKSCPTVIRMSELTT